MIASLTGRVQSFTSTAVVLDVRGVGYLTYVTARVQSALKIGDEVSLFTTLVVREDAMTLYGFESVESRDFFELLQSVTGIGPKVAQSALSIYPPNELASAIASENSAAIERIPGLGKKGAQRVVLELKDKVIHFTQAKSDGTRNGAEVAPWREQLLMALVGLGFSAREANARIDFIQAQVADAGNQDISELLRSALAAGAQS